MKLLRTPLALALVSLLAACATQQAAAPAAPAVPAALKPSDNEKEAFTWRAIGAQLYECRAGEQGKMGWALAGLEAELFNARNEKVGTHGTGPYWASLDGSRAVGTIKARAPGQRAADIPWLLLAAKPEAKPGKLANVTSVQRINTEGGNAPATGCTAAADAGKRVKEGYTSDYVYFVAK